MPHLHLPKATTECTKSFTGVSHGEMEYKDVDKARTT